MQQTMRSLESSKEQLTAKVTLELLVQCCNAVIL